MVEATRSRAFEGKLMDTRGIANLTPVELNKHAQQLGNTPMEAIYLVIEGVTRKVQLKLESGIRPDR